MSNAAKVGTPLSQLGDNEAVIVSATRTPIGRAYKGTLKDERPDDLAAHAVKSAVAQVKGLESAMIEDLLLGCAWPEGEQGYNMARNVALLAGLGNGVPGATINRYCSSSLTTITYAAAQIMLGIGEVYIAAGTESSSREPKPESAGNTKALNPKFIDREASGLPDAYITMGQTAENVARRFNVSRQTQDGFALNSQMKAKAAQADGLFKPEITPYTLKDGSVYAVDECPRGSTTLEGLANLQPVFRVDGSVTAGNACPLNDGAAAVVLMSLGKARELGITPMARVVSWAVSGLEPEIMGVGPVEAVTKLLKRTGLTIQDIDIFELNEAFASQAYEVCNQLGVDIAKQLNPKGGAIALGHPFGATGARIMTTLLYGLQQFNRTIGIETMCVGGGQGYAALVERLS